MAQYTVKSGCGHTTTVNLFGPGRERDRRLAWMRSPSGCCNYCYADRVAERKAVAQAAALTETDKLWIRTLAQYDAQGAMGKAKMLDFARVNLKAGESSKEWQTVAKRLIALAEVSIKEEDDGDDTTRSC